MNRKIGYGCVTTSGLVTVDKLGRTARHFTGRIRVDYMNDDHYWIIIDQIEGFGDSIPQQPVKAHTIDVGEFIDKGATDSPTAGVVTVEEDCGEIWIPDHMVAALRWYRKDW